MKAAKRRQLWRCPRCGVKLITRNLSHSCGPHTVAKFLADKTDVGRDLFRRFVALIDRCGPYDVAPAKTRVAFLAQVRFASVNRIGEDSIDIHFVLPRALASRRFSKVEQLGRLFVYHLRLRDRRDFDKEFGAWLRLSYDEYGQREWLTKRGPRA